MKNYVASIILRLLFVIVPEITPVVKEELNRALSSLEAKAKETDNKIDDLFVQFLRAIVNK